MKKFGFTLAEVLITLAIIGIVAALTLPSLITKINNKGYAERLIKTYSTLQNVTNIIIQEDGLPSTWNWESDAQNSNAWKIFDAYKSHLNVVKVCRAPLGFIEDDCAPATADTKTLNGKYQGFGISSENDIWGGHIGSMVLQDGTLINIKVKSYSTGVYWAFPSNLVFYIDVNGKKAPNKIGRDIFFFYLTNAGKVLPFLSDDITHALGNSCDINSTGHSCAYKVITEGKMNY